MKAINTTIQKLQDKANLVKGSRMPSLDSIASLLSHYKISYDLGSSRNYMSDLGKYGKSGKCLRIQLNGGGMITLDTSCSYYSMNSFTYANRILDLIS